MKKYLPLFFSFFLLSANPSMITFAKKINGKSGPLEAEVFRQMRNTFNSTIFIETGTYVGATTKMVSYLFNHVYTVELSPALYKRAKYHCHHRRNISIYCMKSKDFLPMILEQTPGKRLFWLDAHCSNGETVGGSMNEVLVEEFEALNSPHFYEHDVIMIDDLRDISDGCAQNLVMSFLQLHPDFTCSCIGDVLLLYSKKLYPQVNISPICNATALSLLNHLKEDDQSISKVIQAEKTLFDPDYLQLYQHDVHIALNSLKIWDNDKPGLYYLWQGLLYLKIDNYGKSIEYLQLATNLLQKPRVKAYLAKAYLQNNNIEKARADLSFKSNLSDKHLRMIFSQEELELL